MMMMIVIVTLECSKSVQLLLLSNWADLINEPLSITCRKLQNLVHDFRYLRFDYSNSLCSGISQGSLHLLQMVQMLLHNLLLGLRSTNTTSPHWSPSNGSLSKITLRH